MKYNVNNVHRRTKEQAGNGHVDNKKEQIHLTKISNKTVEELASVKGKLLKIVNELEAACRGTMKL